MQFPEYRPRRLRRTDSLRRMVRETSLSPDNFVYPIFVRPGKEARPIPSMPGVSQVGVDGAVKLAEEAFSLGVPAVILFGVPDDAQKDAVGNELDDELGAERVLVDHLG